ncbi:hypothetical protein OROHE_001656 [Orobanche hederae]
MVPAIAVSEYYPSTRSRKGSALNFRESERVGFMTRRRSGRSNQQRQFSGGDPTKGGDGASSAPTNPPNRSFKKYNNALVGQPAVGAWNVDSSDSSDVQNGAHQQQPMQKHLKHPVAKSLPISSRRTSTLKTTRPIPKSPSNIVPSAAASSDVTNATLGASKSVHLQFGSISHLETHEELRLESSPDQRVHPSVQPRTQPISSFPPNMPMKLYRHTYKAALCYPSSSVPLSSTQVTVKLPIVSNAEKDPPPRSLSVGSKGFKTFKVKG